MTLGELISTYRKEHGLSQRKFAERCGNKITHGYISMLEKNKNPNNGKPLSPSMDVYRAVATGIGMQLDDMLAMLDDDQLVSFNVPDPKQEKINEIMELASQLPPDKLAVAQSVLKALAENP